MILSYVFRRTFKDLNGDGDVRDAGEMINMTGIETSFFILMTSKEIRKSFLDFFKEKKSGKIARSSSVVPLDDPTLLFTNAGMNQFKPIFLDQIKTTNPRLVNSQKCIRVSGKHNDLEKLESILFIIPFLRCLVTGLLEIITKKESIQWAWELFTEKWELDKNRLWATVYKDDDEAFNLWLKVTDIKPERVIRCGTKDNF